MILKKMMLEYDVGLWFNQGYVLMFKIIYVQVWVADV